MGVARIRNVCCVGVVGGHVCGVCLGGGGGG